MSFHTPQQIQQLLKNYEGLWMIAGGWAIDLYLHKITRNHHDIEIAIPRKDQLKLKTYLKDWHFRYVKSGIFYDWADNVTLQLPIHEIHGHFENQQLEVLLNEVVTGQWQFRRNKAIRYPLEKLIRHSQAQIPILCPEIVLLYKAKNYQEKDSLDLKNTLPHLDKPQIDWLQNAIRQTHGPQHQWLSILDRFQE